MNVNMNIIKSTAADLIKVFQNAILDLSIKLDSDKDSMSPEDIESTNYVVGMATINSLNLEQVAKQDFAYYEANQEKVDRLLAEATGFANSLKQSGFGLAS